MRMSRPKGQSISINLNMSNVVSNLALLSFWCGITVFGTGDPKQMAGGISQALVTTMLGLIFAAPLLAMYTLLSEKVSGILQEIEEFVAVNIVKKIK